MTDFIQLKDAPFFAPFMKDSTFLGLPSVDPHGAFAVLHNTQNSFVLSPQKQPSLIIKFPKYHLMVSCDKEAALLNQFSAGKDDVFSTPRALAFGASPEFLMMNRMAKPFAVSTAGEELTHRQAEKIGIAFGSFSAMTFRQGMIHTDFHFGNVTQEPDGKIGILDFAALRHAPLEQLLSCPILTNDILAHSIAKTFCALTGERFGLGKLQGEKTYLFAKMHNNPSLTPDILDRHQAVFDRFMAKAKQTPSCFYS
ncbi:MAG: AarF/UbiB family protein [Bdellovibrionales bacterium]